MLRIKRIVTGLLIIILSILTISINIAADAGEERTVYLSATEYDYPPFSVTDKGEPDGFSVELLKAVAEEMGIVVTFKIDQWSIIKEELKNGELDILPLVGYTIERDEVYDFTVPYIVMRGNIFVRKGDIQIQSQDDLFGKEILVLEGDNSQEWALSIGLDSELTATATYLEAFQLLSQGEYDAVLAQGLVGEKLISDNKIQNIEPVYIYDDNGINRYKLNLEGYEQKFCFAVVEGDTALLSILNEGLSIVSANGTYDTLYQKWFPFLHEESAPTFVEILRYVAYVLLPILVILVFAYIYTTRRTIRIRTKEIIEEKERSETYLRNLILSGQIFETSILNAPIPIMIHAQDGEVLNISETWTRLTGYTKEDIPTIFDWTEKAYGLEKDEVREHIAKLYHLTEVLHDGEYSVNIKDGSTLIWDFHSMCIGNHPDGRAIAMIVAMDVTERVKMEADLKESEQRFKILNNASFGGIAVHDKGLILECNQGLADITGYTLEELIGMDGLLLIDPDSRETVLKNITSGYEKPYEVFGIRKNGEIYPLKLEAKNLPYKGKQVRAVEFRDITEQRQAQKALLDSETRFKTLFEKAPLGYQSLDENGYFLVVNQTWLDILGYRKEEVIGKWFGDFLVEKYRDVFQERFEIFKKRGKIHSEFEMIHKFGHHLFIEFEGLIGYDKFHNFQQTYCTLNDITERKILELDRLENVRRIQESEEQYRLLTTQMPLGFAVHEIICNEAGRVVDFRFLSVNDAWEKVMGVSKDFVLGKKIMEIFPNTESYWIEAWGEVALTGKPIHYENYASELKKHISSTVYSTQKGFFAVIVEDITEKKNLEMEKEYFLTHDILTGLTTRLYFNDQIPQLDQPGNLPISLINFDINGLIIINEAFGHDQGNEFLILVAKLLKETFPEQCVISRVGGDQFAVLLQHVSKAVAEKLARKVANRVKEFDFQGVQLSIAFGVATKTEVSQDIKKLFTIAENEMYSNKIFESQSLRNQSIQAMIKAYHEKNPREERHSNRVSNLCAKFGEALEMSDDEINKLKAISYLHDIGKIAIDEAILNKTEQLTEEEWEAIKKHPEIGARIISTSDEYAIIADDILAHHERYDGKGYPRKLSGEDIPYRARIIAIIDSFDAMSSDRPYRKAMKLPKVIEEMKRCSGTQFDPKLLNIFIEKVIPQDVAE